MVTFNLKIEVSEIDEEEAEEWIELMEGEKASIKTSACGFPARIREMDVNDED